MRNNQSTTEQKEIARGVGRFPKNTKQLSETLPEIGGGGQAPDIYSMPLVNDMSWPDMSKTTMKPQNTVRNVAHLLNHYGVTVRMDVIKKDLRIRFPGKIGISEDLTDTSMSDIVSLMDMNNMKDKNPMQHLINIGTQNPVNPVMDFITSKPWDGKSRIADLIDTISVRPGFDRGLIGMLMTRWLISAVAAAAMPSGFWSKGVLVFQGPQSAGKTEWVRRLLPKELSQSLIKISAVIDLKTKDSIIEGISYWLCEIGELDATIGKANNAKLKGFISRPIDEFRKPYAKTAEKYQRRTVFFASVNPDEFMTDETGSVRYWTIPVIRINYEHDIDMQQLWAEVYGLYKDGERWWLTREEEAKLEISNQSYQQIDPIEELITSRYGEAIGNRETEPKTATDVLYKIGYDRLTKAQRNVAAKVLRKLFGEPKRTEKGRFFNVPVIQDNGYQRHQDESMPF